MTGLIMFIVALFLLALGFPVAFTFAGVALLFGVLSEGMDLFAFMPYRIQNIMENTILMSVPLFVFMGVVLQKTKLAEQLLESMARLFGRMPGGIAISTVLVGALLAASTGVVGASVVAMGLISLPAMLKHNYDKALSCGTICASGTLGQIIPPSVILIILGDVLGVPVGDLFHAAVAPGLFLVALYLGYILVVTLRDPSKAPAMTDSENIGWQQIVQAIKSIIPPLLLIVTVLGSIMEGIATPTASSALGGIGAIILAMLYRQFSLKMLWDSARETILVSAMVFAILIGATAFSMTFNYTGGDHILEQWLLQLPGEKWGFLILTMLIIFMLGFFIDFVEICFIVVPVLAPVAIALNIDLLWFAILIAVNLQTSFLTPPFGFSLFYLKGVAPPSIRTRDIYRGVVPFIMLQVLGLTLIMVAPGWFGL